MNLKKRIYEILGPAGQAYTDQIRYRIGLLPRVNPQGQNQPCSWLPSPYKAGLVISADLELGWAWRYVRDHPNPHKLALQKAQQARQNLPRLLYLFDQYEVPVTWGTVGHLLLESCERGEGFPHPEMPRLPYFENEYWNYTRGDWYDADPCFHYEVEQAWYAPDLIRAIQRAKVKHEIGCHTFSHIDCSDSICPSDVINAELDECLRLAALYGIQLKSFIFPGNKIGSLASLKEFDFTCYREHTDYHLDIPRRDDYGFCQIPGGMCWEKPIGWSVDSWIEALNHCMDRARETNTLMHLWFHPSCEPVNIEKVFPAVLNYYAAHSEEICVKPMGNWVG